MMRWAEIDAYNEDLAEDWALMFARHNFPKKYGFALPVVYRRQLAMPRGGVLPGVIAATPRIVELAKLVAAAATWSRGSVIDGAKAWAERLSVAFDAYVEAQS